MTIVAIWYEENHIWAVADTRLSSKGGAGGYIKRTDNAPKILTLNIECKILSGPESYYAVPYFSTSFGFAFAGHAVSALLIYANVSTLISNLFSVSGNKDLPNIEHVGSYILSITKSISNSYIESTNGAEGGVQIALFGMCPSENKFKCIIIECDKSKGEYNIRIIDFSKNEDEIILLGTGAERFNKHIEKLKVAGDCYQRTKRLPKIAIRNMINEDDGDVGGGISIATSNILRTEAHLSVEPIVLGQPKAGYVFNGMVLDDMIYVGNFIVARTGMI